MDPGHTRSHLFPFAYGFLLSRLASAPRQRELGGLDMLVNNAAYPAIREQLDEFSSELFDRIFKTNVYTIFGLCRAALPHLPPGGSICPADQAGTTLRVACPSRSELHVGRSLSLYRWKINVVALLGTCQ